MKTRLSLALVVGLTFTISERTNAQNAPIVTNTQEVAAQAAVEQQQQDSRTVRSVMGMDPARIATIGLWPGPPIPCKLPKRDKPYTCRRILAGPVIVLTRLPFEFIVSRGDEALAQGKRSWWTNWNEVPLALAPGEVLYYVGTDWNGNEQDRVATIYRP